MLLIPLVCQQETLRGGYHELTDRMFDTTIDPFGIDIPW